MSNHAWCQDIARDAAVRAAEDGMAGPLPTLGECIERQKQSQTARPCGGTDTASLGGEPSGAVNGMRTERVTLEFEVERGSPPSEWPWSYILSRSDALKMRPGESVRVVDEEERQAPPTTKTATTENDYVPPAPTSRPAETRQTKAERIGGGWWFPKCDKPSAPPPPPPAPPRVHRGSGVFDANGDEVPWEGVVASLTEERDAAIRERDELKAHVAELEKRSSFLSQHKEAYAYETMLDGWEIGSREWAESEPELHWIKLTAPENGNANGSEGDRGGAGCVRCVGAGDHSVLDRDAGCGVEVAPAASGGGEPVAWMCEWTDHAELYGSKIQAERAAAGDVVPQPLYRSPPQPRGWLTEEERKAIAFAADQAPESDFVTTSEGEWVRSVLTALLARSTPPEGDG